MGERLNKVLLPLALTGALGGAVLSGANVNSGEVAGVPAIEVDFDGVDNAAAWAFKPVPAATAAQTCPDGSQTPTDGPVIYEVGNGEMPRADGTNDYRVDAEYRGYDIDYLLEQKDENGKPTGVFSDAVVENFTVKPGQTERVQITTPYKAGEVISATFKYGGNRPGVHVVKTSVKVVPAVCEQPSGETTGTPAPTPETTSTSTTGEVTETTDSTIDITTTNTQVNKPKPTDNPSRIEVTKEDITYNGKIYVSSDGVVMGRVRPGELTTTRVTARAFKDYDSKPNEVERTRVVVNFPDAQNGRPGQYGYDPIKKRWVQRITRTVNLVEGGKAKVWNFKTKNTVDAAEPPQVLCNTVTAWSGGVKKDRAEACLFDPKENTLLATRDSKLGRYVITIK